jgi:hypothetical protein
MSLFHPQNPQQRLFKLKKKERKTGTQEIGKTIIRGKK